MSNLETILTKKNIAKIVYSDDVRIDALLDNSLNWNYLIPFRTTLYYAFDINNSTDSKLTTPLTAFNNQQKDATREILNYAAEITGITFTEVETNSQADLHFAATDLAGTRVSGLANNYYNYRYNAQQEIISYNAESYLYIDNVEWAKNNNSPISGPQGYETLLHEIGHALGLKHSFESPFVLPNVDDNTNNTVMSYKHKGDYKTQFQSYDLAALNWIYGGDGLGGISNSSIIITQTPKGTLSDDFLVGTNRSEKIDGLAGNDTLNGATGRDTLLGGNGNDKIEGGIGNDKLTGGRGNDAFIFNYRDYDFLGDFVEPKQNLDTITDFTKNIDVLQFIGFENSRFAVTKSLKTFVDANLIFETETRTLYFDADGSQARYMPTAIIKFTGNVNLTESDLQFIANSDLRENSQVI